jgi:hypothetical protein
LASPIRELDTALQTVAECLSQLIPGLIQLAELSFELADHFPDFVTGFTGCGGHLFQLREVALDFVAHFLVKLNETLPPLNLIQQTTLNLRLNAGFLLGLVCEQVVQLLFEVIDADFGFSDRQQSVSQFSPSVLPLASNSRRRSANLLRTQASMRQRYRRYRAYTPAAAGGSAPEIPGQ